MMNAGNILLLTSIWLETYITVSRSDISTKCTVCKDMTDNFLEKMTKTEKHGFGGGNTDWEESRLGTYAKSESRLLEILDEVCIKVSKESICHAMIEEYESDIYSWWYKKTEEQPSLKEYLCTDKIKVCCPENTYGSSCKECPGGKVTPCSGHGSCQGAGTRGGNGKCSCDNGYEGDTCSECQDGYYDAGNTTCKTCHEACKSTCTEAGTSGCDDCKDGWLKDPEEGCKDEDECEKSPCSTSEFCVNSVGSYECEACDGACKESCKGPGSANCVECNQGYLKNGTGGCEDIDECSTENLCTAGTYCQNAIGSYNCEPCHDSCEFECTGRGNTACNACRNGYEMVDGGCKDIDECAGKDGQSLCTDDSQYCKNTEGGFECESCDKSCQKCIGPGESSCVKCRNGFEMVEGSCKDVDECLTKNACNKQTEQCENTDGSYKCSCKTGYKKKEGKCVKDEDIEDDDVDNEDDHDEL
ncbi:cysteine-rich with EGF-like domain protein 2-A isoform X2 [Rhopilema esculentum]|uniref:cysteine-rich with EGF-like domain protein 2-A isoform X2 n=1 Tax=Rhopilema esculentum TaxID=499914 RepID=UPI0031D7C3F2